MAREPVYSVTSARSGQRDEIGGRERRYAIAMAIRSLCFIGGVIAWQTIDARFGAILFVVAIVLPYTSVILANAGVRKHATGSDLLLCNLGRHETTTPPSDRLASDTAAMATIRDAVTELSISDPPSVVRY